MAEAMFHLIGGFYGKCIEREDIYQEIIHETSLHHRAHLSSPHYHRLPIFS